MKGFLRSLSSSRRSSMLPSSFPRAIPRGQTLIHPPGPGDDSEQDYPDDSPEAILLREMVCSYLSPIVRLLTNALPRKLFAKPAAGPIVRYVATSISLRSAGC
jgi:hypothetical protein